MNISELAAEKLKDVLNEEGAPEASLRILATPGENGGLSYMMTLEKQVKEEDSVVHTNGVSIVVDKESVSLLQDVEIDYVEGLMRSGFVISNPNFESEGGGCGGGGGGCACGGQCGCGGH
jgi:iron-sulfur cluster assembly accessory protein